MRVFSVVAVAAGLSCSTPALAQTASGSLSRGFVAINGIYQLTSNDFADSGVKREHAENGSVQAAYLVQSGQSLEVSGGARVWRKLSMGVGFSRFSTATPSAVSAAIPHPFFFNRLRSVAGQADGLKREELVVHLQAAGVFPVGRRLNVTVFGGPAFFKVTQGVVTDVSYRDSYPFDEASFGGAITTTADVSKVGFGGGGDVAFYFTRFVGIGGTFQFAGTTVRLPAAGGATQSVKVGGLRTGAGLRLRL